MEGGSGGNKGQLKQKALMKDKVMKKDAAALGDDVESDEDIANYKASEDDEKKIGGAGGGNGKKSFNCGGGGSMRICQAERCTADLSDAKAKQYHRRHRVCEVHAKAPAVVVAGISQRFCQQCSRFHELSEFDDTKRSCRRRLAGHNERRRKNTADPTGESSSRRGTAGCTQFMENVCVGQVDDRGRTQVSIGQEYGNGNYNKHFPYQIR